MDFLDKLASLLSMCCGLSLLIRRICCHWKTREKAQAAGILYRHFIPRANLWILVVNVLLTFFLCWNVYGAFRNYRSYNRIADYVEIHGIEKVLKYEGLSEDAIGDTGRFTENYISTQRTRAVRSFWWGVSEIGILLLILSIILWQLGGFVTAGGWYWMFSNRKPEVIHIREEDGRLCFYLGEAGSAVMKLPDTLDNRDRFAPIMETMTE